MKAVLIDDDAQMLSSCGPDLLSFDSRIALVSVGSTRSARLVLAGSVHYDFIVVDLDLRQENGFDLLAELCHAHPATPVIAVSGSDLNADAVRAIYLGAVAFVPRRAGGRGLVAALRAAAAGKFHVAMAVEKTSAPTPNRSAQALTPRQEDVLSLLMQGQSNKTMARELNLSVDTVKDHVTAVLRNLNVKSRTQAVLAASETARRAPITGRTSV